jgi:hypothetical protein
VDLVLSFNLISYLTDQEKEKNDLAEGASRKFKFNIMFNTRHWSDQGNKEEGSSRKFKFNIMFNKRH